MYNIFWSSVLYVQRSYEYSYRETIKDRFFPHQFQRFFLWSLSNDDGDVQRERQKISGFNK